MSICGDCNFYCEERRICIRDKKFYFESFPSCEKYEKDIDIDELDMMGYILDMENLE